MFQAHRTTKPRSLFYLFIFFFLGGGGGGGGGGVITNAVTDCPDMAQNKVFLWLLAIEKCSVSVCILFFILLNKSHLEITVTNNKQK